MSAAFKIKDLVDYDYLFFYEGCVEKVKSGTVTEDNVKSLLREMETKIDRWHEESDFFDKEKADKLLAQSEALLQDLPSYSQDVRIELLAAILYFVSQGDGIPDNHILGLDDDDEIMSAVLKKHGIDLI